MRGRFSPPDRLGSGAATAARRRYHRGLGSARPGAGARRRLRTASALNAPSS